MRKIISIVLSFGLLFQQGGLVYAAGEINLASYLSQARNVIVQPDVFQPARLRYISYDIANNDFKLLLDKGNAKLNDATPELFNYFLIGLALPNDTFWVNLRPDAPENIIDPLLEKTDIGKIFLEADLQLKKDTASLTSPQNPEGKLYWDKLYKKAGELFGTENITIPTITRPWIVPNEVIVRETEDSAYIYKATLKVMLEQDHLKDSLTYNFSDPRLKELNEYSSQIIRETIIPKLTKEVNSSKRYAQLRQVYYSLVLSRWFKQKYSSFGSTRAQGTSTPANSYLSLIDSGNLDKLASKEPCDKQTYFQAYQKSFKDGEYNLKETVATPFGQSIRSYVSGGLGLGLQIDEKMSILGNPGGKSVTKALEAGLAPVDPTATFSGSPLTRLRDFLSALEIHSKSHKDSDSIKPYYNDAISNLINTIKQQIKLISEGRYPPSVIKIGKRMIETEWKDLCSQMPKIEKTLSPKYNDVIEVIDELLIAHSIGAGSPIGVGLSQKTPDTWRLVRFGDLSESVKQILKARAQDAFPEVRMPEIADNDAFVVELNLSGGIDRVLAAWIVKMNNGIYSLKSLGEERKDVIGKVLKSVRAEVLSVERIKEEAKKIVREYIYGNDSKTIAFNSVLYLKISGEYRNPNIKEAINNYYVEKLNIAVNSYEAMSLVLEKAIKPFKEIVKAGELFYDLESIRRAGEISLTYSKLIDELRAYAVAGSPVQLGEEFEVYDGDTAKYVKLWYVSYNDLAESIGKNKIKELLNNVVFQSKINGSNAEDMTIERINGAGYLRGLPDESVFKNMRFAIGLDKINVKIEGTIETDGKEIIAYGKTVNIANALVGAWAEEKELANVSSAVVSGQVPNKKLDKLGGIDLTDRALHIKLERVGSFASTPLLLPQVKNVQDLDLDKEFEQVEALASSGIVPNSHRLLELFTVCHYRGEFGERLNQIISCLKAASAIQEVQAIDTDEDFRLALMMPEVLS